jgi:hypothetical protein
MAYFRAWFNGFFMVVPSVIAIGLKVWVTQHVMMSLILR